MRENNTILLYFGFLRGRFSKSFFLLFCSSLIFPLDRLQNSQIDYFFIIFGYCMVGVSFLQLIKGIKFNTKDKDQTD